VAGAWQFQISGDLAISENFNRTGRKFFDWESDRQTFYPASGFHPGKVILDKQFGKLFCGFGFGNPK